MRSTIGIQDQHQRSGVLVVAVFKGAQMNHADQEIQSVGEYVSKLVETAHNGVVWYRGQSDINWKLLPKIARPGGRYKNEIHNIKRFQQNARMLLPSLPKSAWDWEWMFLMQHHKGVTRLLDWSENPLVALYFALDKKNKNDGVVWCLDPIALNSYSVPRSSSNRDILAFGIDDVLKNYLPDRVTEATERPPVAAIGPRNSHRMVAQASTFTIASLNKTPIEDVDIEDKKHVWRFIVPAGKKDAIKKELRILGVNEFFLFPELETLATHTEDLLR